MEYKRKNSAERAEKNKIICINCKQLLRPKLERSCPSCGKIILYKTTGDLNRANSKNAHCPSCAKLILQNKEYFVVCIKCGSKHYYKWEKTVDQISKSSFICKPCLKIEEEKIIYSRKCAQCGKEKIYKNKYIYNKYMLKLI